MSPITNLCRVMPRGWGVPSKQAFWKMKCSQEHAFSFPNAPQFLPLYRCASRYTMTFIRGFCACLKSKLVICLPIQCFKNCSKSILLHIRVGFALPILRVVNTLIRKVFKSTSRINRKANLKHKK
jgi:hypothetical protein